MQFKRLEIIGFKSFAEKTEVRFEPGVTAIVGPNGCGKSNVADAIRWVLGEQSAKSLRGSSMEDVIFNGSAARDAVNVAEVSLTLDNSAKLLAIDYEEVTITRRLYRDGESEYLLNKNAVRLKDIHELLLGTGIGTENYSIIEQGKMDRILNSKPDERREIFEEAAGITKYKSKKKEALRKLEQTDANLLRVNDIVVEVKRQIGSIERQAKKAEAYKREFEKMKGLEIAVASREFLAFEDRRRGREEELAALKAREAEYRLELETLEEACRARRDELARADETLRAKDAEEMAAAAEVRRNQDRALLNRERVGELLERRENLLKQIEDADRRVEEYRAEHAKLGTEFETVLREEEEGKAFLSTVESQFAAIEEAIRAASRAEGEARESLASVGERRAALATDLAKLDAQSAMFRAHAEGLRERRESLSAEEREILKVLDRPLSDADIEQRSRALWLEPRIREFKERLVEAFRAFFAKGDAAEGSDEAMRLDAEIEGYTDGILKTQGQITENRVRLQEAEGRRRRLEQEMGGITAELDTLAREEASVAERRSGLSNETQGLTAEESSLAAALVSAQGALREKNSEKETLLVRLAETRSHQSHCTARREKIEKDRGWVLESAAAEEGRRAGLAREAEDAASRREAIEAENVQLEEEIVRLSQRRDDALLESERLRAEREETQTALAIVERERDGRLSFLKGASDQVHAFELEQSELRHEIDRLKERIFNAYQVDLLTQSLQRETMEGAQAAFGQDVPMEALDLEAARAEIAASKEKLAKMGPVNLVAIEEYEEMRQRHDFLVQQQADLLQAKDDLHKAIQKINRTTKELFTETFAQVRTHFTAYYRLLFGGGAADLVLLDESDVLESGIEIVARPPGKKLQQISLLSGGEKALTAVALLFSLFKVRPSPFCVLDEIDAPLDESNVERFCNVLREFITGSQFILITHNKRTMGLADALYGITMAQTGVSRVVSVKFSEGARKEAVHANGSANGNGRHAAGTDVAVS